MKYSISTYSFGPYILPDQLGIYGVIDKAADMGFDGIEFVESDWMDVPDDELRAIGDYARSKGLETVSLCVGADLLNGCGGDTDAEIARICGRVDKAALLGVGLMRHDVTAGIEGKQNDEGFAQALPILADACRRIATYAEARGIRTVSENHGFFYQGGARVAALVEAVAHPNYGVLLDLGNFMCADETPPQAVALLASRAFHVHAKDFLHKTADPGAGWFRTRGGNYLRGTIIGHGVADVDQSIGILKKSGYNGWITVEFEGMEERLEAIRLGLENVKRFWDIA